MSPPGPINKGALRLKVICMKMFELFSKIIAFLKEGLYLQRFEMGRCSPFRPPLLTPPLASTF